MTTQGQQSGASKTPHDVLSVTAKAPQTGYAYVFVSNEHPTAVEVHFDDVTVTHTPSVIIAENEYYPFGLSREAYISDQAVSQSYRYNGKEQQDELGLDWYDYGARMYMADIGRWGAVDPLAEMSRRWSPYTYALDNPMRFIDPDGMYASEAMAQTERDFGMRQLVYLSPDADASKYLGTQGRSSVNMNSRVAGTRPVGKVPGLPDLEPEPGARKIELERGARQVVPGITVIEFGPDHLDPDNLGIDIKLGFNDPNKQFSEYGWIQTVRTNQPQNFPNRPLMGKYEPFNDTPGDDKPYYPMSFYNTEGFSSLMVDHTGRDKNSTYVIWRAEVTIGGIKNGVFIPIGTMTYGYDIFDGKLDVVYPHVTQPTPWHVDSFTNKSKW